MGVTTVVPLGVYQARSQNLSLVSAPCFFRARILDKVVQFDRVPLITGTSEEGSEN